MKDTKNHLYIQYGCGLSAPDEWINFDASPTIILQKIPVIGSIISKYRKVNFPKNVRYGNIVKGLPVRNGKSKGVYCSHVLEHLSLDDFRIALKNTYKLLAKDGIFRCLVPDLEYETRKYLKCLDNGIELASIEFIETTLLGEKKKEMGIKGIIKYIWGHSKHLWMWDEKSLKKELFNVGFRTIRTCKYNDSEDDMFAFVENKWQFNNAVALECKK